MSRSLLFVLAIAAVGCIGGRADRSSDETAAPAAPSVPSAKPKPGAHTPVAELPPRAEAASAPPVAAEQMPASVTPEYAASRGRSIQWKRNAAFEADLMRGLELTRDELCQELGSQSCIRAVHTVALGGNDPFGSGLLRPPASSLSTTPLAVDRVTLSACSQRARADKQGNPKVFTALDFAGPAPAASSDEVKRTITALFHRLLGRDPKPTEVATLDGLLAGEGAGMSAEDFATLSCFVVASSLEALFF